MTELLEPINFGEYEVKKYSHGRGRPKSNLIPGLTTQGTLMEGTTMMAFAARPLTPKV